MSKKELENRIKTLLKIVNAEIENLKIHLAQTEKLHYQNKVNFIKGELIVMIQERFRLEELLKDDKISLKEAFSEDTKE